MATHIYTPSTRLPDIMSELIDVTLTAIEWCEQQPGYEFHIATWHVPQHSGLCSVCIAGAIMAHSLDADPTKSMEPSDYDDHTQLRLLAVDFIRSGKITAAADRMKIKAPSYLNRKMHHYSTDRDQFFTDMRKIADDLRGVGL